MLPSLTQESYSVTLLHFTITKQLDLETIGLWQIEEKVYISVTLLRSKLLVQTEL